MLKGIIYQKKESFQAVNPCMGNYISATMRQSGIDSRILFFEKNGGPVVPIRRFVWKEGKEERPLSEKRLLCQGSRTNSIHCPGIFRYPMPGVSSRNPARSLPLLMLTRVLRRMAEFGRRRKGLTARRGNAIS